MPLSLSDAVRGPTSSVHMGQRKHLLGAGLTPVMTSAIAPI
jgi:hypothetical protein